MKFKTNKIWALVIIACYFSISCEEFVDVDAPDNKLIREDVFRSEETAVSAMTGIYNQLFLTAFSNGYTTSVSFLAGLSADNIRNINTNNLGRMEFEQHELFPNNPNILELWSSAYSMIYMTNSFLEGLANSSEITPDIKNGLEGQARFVRAFCYFYLVNLYGDVPLLLSSNYRENELAPRDLQIDIYSQIIDDLQTAIDLLGNEYEGERTQVNSFAAKAMLARVYLYLEDWEMAESQSSEVIEQNSTYEILENLDQVFLANSREAIWQISPIGRGNSATHTNDGNLFIIDPLYSFFASNKMENDFIAVFEEQDKRLSQWTGFNESRNAHYSHKYKIWNKYEFPIEEYSMVLRLAEQYLIRAEARAEQGNISGAIEDIEVIRNRAGVDLISETNPGINKEDLLDEIIEERRKELFTEWGHRWFDLKRTGVAGEILSAQSPLWEETDMLYPIPAEERMRNPNLSQNPGY